MPRVRPLSIAITPGDSRSIARQVTDAIRLKITAGDLDVGDKLPSVRGLAQQLRVNPNTISKAYAELTNEGWVVSSAGLGLFVARAQSPLSRVEQNRRLDMAVERFVGEAVALRVAPDAALERAAASFETLLGRKSA